MFGTLESLGCSDFAAAKKKAAPTTTAAPDQCDKNCTMTLTNCLKTCIPLKPTPTVKTAADLDKKRVELCKTTCNTPAEQCHKNCASARKASMGVVTTTAAPMAMGK
eukprot:NODE_4609_length_459_cov_853.614634_g3951_i1.p2 GENE.NODE_4609_length_459_cov_853.614634_g3951_i1~~NODE_4609_length_459_cov_853.614634_g3951_i1.p2  ORF type:complete len:107 (-),score=35.62 NODE_4609_length_459_cov_853.614634_g3951_i1:77-397(-)